MSKRISIYPKKKQQYKVNLHAHTNVSDGKFSPEEVKAIYKAEGYSAVAFTDHRNCVPHPELTDDTFVALTGVELDFWETDETGILFKAVHFNALAPEQDMTYSVPKEVPETPDVPLDFDRINEKISELKEKGFYITLNHPVWSNMSCADVEKIHGFDAMEVYNSIAVMFNNYSDDSAFYQYYLRSGGAAAPVAADDCHHKYHDGGPGTEYAKGFVYVLAEELSYDALFKAVQQGDFYASTGPKMKALWLEGDILHLECSPVSGVYVHTKYITKKVVLEDKDNRITKTDLDISELRKCSPFIWVTIQDADGKKAWSVPYWFK